MSETPHQDFEHGHVLSHGSVGPRCASRRRRRGPSGGYLRRRGRPGDRNEASRAWSTSLGQSTAAAESSRPRGGIAQRSRGSGRQLGAPARRRDGRGHHGRGPCGCGTRWSSPCTSSTPNRLSVKHRTLIAVTARPAVENNEGGSRALRTDGSTRNTMRNSCGLASGGR